ncbi:MAG TPA: DUF6146 family protein [Prolixibacteraceae bacterium]|nr:DUF6146 family protein [Prolixibacteraceae bacterium]
MKKIIVWIGIILFVAACSSQKKAVETKHKTIEVATEDSLEYQLETFDQGFESWYLLHDNPSQYHSQSYYEGWNRQYVSAWNANAMDSRKASFFEPIVGYDPTVDYGFELNHQLFYYFLYVENVLKIRIMSGGPKAVLF